MSTVSSLALRHSRIEAELLVPEDGPVLLAALRQPGGRSLLSPYPLATIFTAAERQATRMSPGYAGSVIGERLRYADHRVRAGELEVHQIDSQTGIQLVTTLTAIGPAIRITHVVRNDATDELLLLSLSGVLLGYGESERIIDDLELTWGESGWTTEGRWREQPLRALVPDRLDRYGQDTAPSFGRTSQGTWSTGTSLPVGILVDRKRGAGIAWELVSGGPWHWEVGATPTGGYLAVHGPTDRHHAFAHRLSPGAEFEAPSVLIACSDQGADGAIAALTDARRAARGDRAVDVTFPVVYNDFMNTLMGQPSTEKLEPLIRAAARAGAEYFCVDAGWFADPGVDDWWDSIGDWREAPGRFSGGLREVMEQIRSVGMMPGLWLEPEAVGVSSAAAQSLPREAFFQRHGHLVVSQQRFHLDFRHPVARMHADHALDHLVGDLGVGYVKLDYNIDPGAGTDWEADSPADGLLGHVRAYRRWLADARMRHPSVLFENCAAGAMRMDAGLIALSDLQSTSDQPDFARYPAIAASAPLSMPPERAGNWAYPAAEMTNEETAFSLVAGLIGRLCLSGFLDRLSPAQFELVREAVALAKDLRPRVAEARPFWPLGLPQWDGAQVALGLQGDDGCLVALWSRGEAARVEFELPARPVSVEQVFPVAASTWGPRIRGTVVSIHAPLGPAARLLFARFED